VLRGDGQAPPAVDLSNGATQTTLTRAPGSYGLRLRFVDDSGRRDRPPITQTRLVVTGRDRL